MEDIGRADVKAGALFRGTGVVLGAVASFLLANPSRYTSLPSQIQASLLVSVGCAVAALAALGAAAYPRGVRGRVPSGGGVMYFGDVVGIPGDAQLRKALGSTREPSVKDLSRQLRQLSLIAYRKYRYIRVASVLVAVSLTAILATVVGLFLSPTGPW